MEDLRDTFTNYMFDEGKGMLLWRKNSPYDDHDMYRIDDAEYVPKNFKNSANIHKGQLMEVNRDLSDAGRTSNVEPDSPSGSSLRDIDPRAANARNGGGMLAGLAGGRRKKNVKQKWQEWLVTRKFPRNRLPLSFYECVAECDTLAANQRVTWTRPSNDNAALIVKGIMQNEFAELARRKQAAHQSGEEFHGTDGDDAVASLESLLDDKQATDKKDAVNRQLLWYFALANRLIYHFEKAY